MYGLPVKMKKKKDLWYIYGLPVKKKKKKDLWYIYGNIFA
jgi:hypothetical protein